jgi:hypothetical protein
MSCKEEILMIKNVVRFGDDRAVVIEKEILDFA